MDALPQNPAFVTYAVCASLLGLKLILSSFYTGFQRRRTEGYANIEDARAFGKPGATTTEPPAVAHALRIQRNDIENIPAFFAIGLVYVLVGASPRGAAAYFWTYTIARIAHTIFYANHLQPWRAIAYFVGVLCMIGMIVQILTAVL
jgi:uncharacterized MAPEG superfamily protein